MVRQVLGRSDLRYANQTRCSRKLARGECKRVMPFGPQFVGYYIGCPGCGFVAAYLDGPVRFEEQPPDRVARVPSRLLGIHGATCPKCSAQFVVEGDELLAVGAPA